MLFLHRPPRVRHRLVAADEGVDIFVAHLLRCVARQRRAESAAAVHDDFCVRIGIKFFQIAFQNSFAKMNRLDRVAGRPLVIFAHIEQHGLGIGREPGAGLGDGEFADRFFRLRDQLEETGGMIHAGKLGFSPGASTEFFCLGRENSGEQAVNKKTDLPLAFRPQLNKGEIVNSLSTDSVKAAGGSPAVHLMLTEGAVRLMGQNSEQVMEDLRIRATGMSKVLEGILNEPHGQPHWGLNE